jgi:hypothetical protein
MKSVYSSETAACPLLLAGYFPGLLFVPEDKCSTFFLNGYLFYSPCWLLA